MKMSCLCVVKKTRQLICVDVCVSETHGLSADKTYSPLALLQSNLEHTHLSERSGYVSMLRRSIARARRAPACSCSRLLNHAPHLHPLRVLAHAISLTKYDYIYDGLPMHGEAIASMARTGCGCGAPVGDRYGRPTACTCCKAKPCLQPLQTHRMSARMCEGVFAACERLS